jgi:hypothetical protein
MACPASSPATVLLLTPAGEDEEPNGRLGALMRLSRSSEGAGLHRLLAIAMIGVVISLCACGSTPKVATTSTKATTSSGSSSTSPAASGRTSSTAAPTTSTSATSGSTTFQTCAERATETFIYIDSVSETAGGGFAVTGNRATLICGGPDDFHWNTSTSTLTATVLQGASIQVLQSAGSILDVPIAAGQFAAYLATDHNTRIFLVTGSLDAISALQEQFHP